MRHDLRWKGFFIFLSVLIFALVLNFVPIRLGLDLKGGIELLLTPDYRVGSVTLDKLSEEIIAKLNKANMTNPTVSYLGVLDGGRYEGLKISLQNPDEAQRALNTEAFSKSISLDVFGEAKKLNLDTTVKGNVIEISVLEDPSDFPADSLERSLTIINHRISSASSGMAEADVRLDGKGRINVQLPGLKSLQEAREMIIATGRLTFRIDNKIVLDGTDMQDVRVALEPGKGYVIHFEFKGNGSKQLEKVTSENINKKMAVYLDEDMLMDPVIQDVISGGTGVISFGGNSNKKEIENYAILMKSGALPISLRVVQSTQVAPTLGKEIVKQSLYSGVIGIGLVVLFMFLFYSIPGLMADMALILYAVFVLGVMALFRGVLTLPGVAGIILGVGMAVDANIIIFERIKDEIRNGKRVRPAVQAGFDRAFITIMDANITTLIAAAVLFFFGTGPVQGFAITLSIGILVSMVTAVFVSRFFLEWRIDQDPDRYAKYFGVKEVV